MKQKPEYYVISPNVRRDRKFDDLLNIMINNKCVLIGWGQDTQKGHLFANLQPGDRIIVSRRVNWNFNNYFLGIVSKKPADYFNGAQRRFLDNFVRIEND